MCALNCDSWEDVEGTFLTLSVSITERIVDESANLTVSDKPSRQAGVSV